MSTSAALPAPNSQTVFAAMARRFLRHGAGFLSGAVLILCGVPALMYGMLWLMAPETARNLGADPVALQTIFRVGEWIMLPAYLLCSVMYVRPLYVLPLTNRQIVGMQLSLGMAAISAVHILTVAFYRIVFGAVIPLAPPLLFLCPAVIVAAGLAGLVVDFRWWRPLVVGLVAVAIVNVVGVRDIIILRTTLYEASTSWLVPSTVELIGIWALAAIGFWLCFRSVAGDRCGEMRSWPDVDVVLQSFAARLSRLWRSPVASRPYRSGRSAHFWYEFWQKGLLLPILAAVIGGASLIAAYHDPQEWLSGLVELAPAMLVFSLCVAGLIFGLVSLGQNKTGISEYRATRPLTDAELAFSVLKAAVASVLVVALIMATYAVLVFLATFGGLYWRRSSFPLAWPETAMIGWCLCGLAASMTLSGRAWVAATPTVLLFSLFLIRPFYELLAPGYRDLVFKYVGAVILAAIVAGVIAAYVLSVRQRIISVGMAAAGGLIWIGAAAYAVGALPDVATRPSPWVIGAWTILVAAPLASAPLALSWNRHR